ncbi:pumilio protein [Trifolium repens]|nr:pumilio protein [Trifolium repens]
MFIYLVFILSGVDDTKLIKKDVVFDKNGRCPVLHPNCSRYFSPDDLASMNSSVSFLSLKNSEVSSPTEISKVSIGDDDSTEDIEMTAHNEVVMKFCPF